MAGTIPVKYSSENERWEVCLVTTTRSGRWGPPKGKVEVGERHIMSAQRETFEEAGLRGTVIGYMGNYKYYRVKEGTEVLSKMYLLKVESEALDYPEVERRKRKWFSIEAAAKVCPQILFLLQKITSMMEAQ
jgi:8-oxo-dGTP pyrophosphatase MutT (NUDIX family)